MVIGLLLPWLFVLYIIYKDGIQPNFWGAVGFTFIVLAAPYTVIGLIFLVFPHMRKMGQGILLAAALIAVSGFIMFKINPLPIFT